MKLILLFLVAGIGVQGLRASAVQYDRICERKFKGVSGLIYDVGMHDGDDTAFYLHKGYRVIAIEADPILAEGCHQRFHEAIQSKQLVVLNVGITAEHGKFTFWKHKLNSTWNSFNRNPEWREEDCESIEVRGVPFRDILAEYGVPYYMKIDIEGADGLCLRALSRADLPQYISFEGGPSSLYGICHLASLGFNAFKLVDQTAHNSPATDYSNELVLKRWRRRLSLWKWDMTRRFQLDSLMIATAWRRGRALLRSPEQKTKGLVTSEQWVFGAHSSGPFGEETAGPWLTFEEAAYNWLHRRFGYIKRGTLHKESWYDWHVTRKQDYPDPNTCW